MTVTSIEASAHPLSHAYVEAAVAAGLPRNPDFNGAAQEGVGLYQLTTRRGLRCSAATAYLNPALGRGSLRLITRAQVTRLVIEGGRAAGVEYRRGRETRRIAARREVILAAGAVGSPQILQLLGIGDGGHLRTLGVEVIRDAPGVGGNLQDHLGVDYIYEANCPTLNGILGTWRGRAAAGARYAEPGISPQTSSRARARSSIPAGPARWDRIRPRARWSMRGCGCLGSTGCGWSMHPTITAGNINAPTIMVGEKGAAMILDDRG